MFDKYNLFPKEKFNSINLYFFTIASCSTIVTMWIWLNTDSTYFHVNSPLNLNFLCSIHIYFFAVKGSYFLKMSWWRRKTSYYLSLSTSIRRLKDVFNASFLFLMTWRRPGDIFRTSYFLSLSTSIWRLKDVFKTSFLFLKSLRRPCDVLRTS